MLPLRLNVSGGKGKPMNRQKERENMNEIQTVITMENAKVSCNFEQVEAAIKEVISEYRGAVFTEDSKAYAKKVVASLRAQKKMFQDNLRDEKKKYMVPWEEFESRAKALIGMYDEPIDMINGQVKEFEEKRIAEKRELIRRVYGEVFPEGLASYFPLKRIYDYKWENATTKEKEIRKAISGICEKIQNETSLIRNRNSEVTAQALSMYQKNLDLAEALNYINAYEQQKSEILAKEQERKRREEEERIRREERERLLAEQQAEMEKNAAVEQAKAETAQEVIDSLIPEESGEAELYEYRISLSGDAKMKLEMYMDSVGIEWELI